MDVTSELQALSAKPGNPQLHLAMGTFDGLHTGHLAVIRSAVDNARASGGLSVIITFDPHPRSVCLPPGHHKLPRSILANLDHKLRLLADLGIDHTVVIPFTQQFRAKSAARFLDELLALNLGSISVGTDWCFGANRKGNAALLAQAAREHGFNFFGIDAIEWHGERVSSTRIRDAIARGDFTSASAMLGRPYSVLGEIVRGRQLGRQLGFPTANFQVFNEQLPPDGVYAMRGRHNGQLLLGVGNLGVRPTIESEGSRRQLEVHFLDWSGNLYGAQMEVEFVRFLRGEKRFASLEDLRQQIDRDTLQAREALSHA